MNSNKKIGMRIYSDTNIGNIMIWKRNTSRWKDSNGNTDTKIDGNRKPGSTMDSY